MLKFLYNITFHVLPSQEIESPYSPFWEMFHWHIRLTAPLIELLTSTCFNKFESPLTNVVHNLLNLPLSQSKPLLFPQDSETKVMGRIIEIIDYTIPEDTDSISDSTIDENLSPVFALLNSILEIPAPDQIKEFMKSHLLPTERYPSLVPSPWYRSH